MAYCVFVTFAWCRVFSAYIKEIDEKPGATEWGSRMPFANLMAEFTSAAGVLHFFKQFLKTILFSLHQGLCYSDRSQRPIRLLEIRPWTPFCFE